MAIVTRRPLRLAALVEIMARLRDPETGCEWDRVQTFATIAPYTIEEAYEVADAIRARRHGGAQGRARRPPAPGRLPRPHGRGARRLRRSTTCMAAICDKMERRHPHIFGDAAASPGWEALKAAERDGARTTTARWPASPSPCPRSSAPRSSSAAPPGSASTGPTPTARAPKIDEELAEIERAEDDEERAAELGDLLFAVVNYARHLDVEPEAALREATARSKRASARSKRLADKPLKDMNIDELEALWQRAKKLV